MTSARSPELHCARVLSVLDSRPWAYQSPAFQALGLSFSVRVADPTLGSYLDQVFRPFHAHGSPEHAYSFVDNGASRGHRRYAVYFGGAKVGWSASPSLALSFLFWHLNRSVVERTPHLLLLHASAVEREGVGMVFPAPMESGKTTLAAGLVQAGMRYVTDEVTAVDPETLRLVPYPKPLSIDPGSWSVLPDLRPTVDDAASKYVGEQWLVNPVSIHPDAVSPGCHAQFIVTPSYQAGSATRLVPMSRADAVVVLAQNAFNLDVHRGAGLEVLAQLVKDCDCYRLPLGSLEEACALLVPLLRQAKSQRPQGSLR